MLNSSRWQTQTVLQEREGDALVGDCMAACVASILNIPLADTPNFILDKTFPENLIAWLKERGYRYAYWWIDLLADREDRPVLPGASLREVMRKSDIRNVGCHIIVGNSPRGDYTHAVVGYDGEVIHDPHPSRAGVGEVQAIVVLTPRDPAITTPHDDA